MNVPFTLLMFFFLSNKEKGLNDSPLFAINDLDSLFQVTVSKVPESFQTSNIAAIG